MIDSTEDYTHVDLASEVDSRVDQPSFHLFSEQHMRGQVYRLAASEVLPEIRYEGTVLVTGIQGTVEATIAGSAKPIGPLGQLLANPKVPFSVTAVTDAVVQLIWCPPFGKIGDDIDGTT